MKAFVLALARMMIKLLIVSVLTALSLSCFVRCNADRCEATKDPVGLQVVSRKSISGFTLIELLIVMLVISILASIAVPSYSAYTRRAKLAEAPTTLSTHQMKMEQAYPDNGQYLCPVAVIPDTAYFSYTCAATTQTFVLSANGKGAVADVTYTVNELGSKATTRYNGHAVPASCWLVSGSEC